jgi:hypothetical protein
MVKAMKNLGVEGLTSTNKGQHGEWKKMKAFPIKSQTRQNTCTSMLFTALFTAA